MKRLMLTLILGALVGVGLAVVVAVVWNVARPQQSVVQPAPVPVSGAPASRSVGLPVLLALACICNLSVVALAGSVALQRRMNRISPDRASPHND